MPPLQVTVTGIEMAAAAALKSVPGFGCRFGTGLVGEDVLRLAPQPAAPFRELTVAVCTALSRYPPFGGAFADVIPHLTVGDRQMRMPSLYLREESDRAE